MREMRGGHWVAFDVSTESPHQCGYQTKPDPNIAALGKKTKKEEPGGIDIGYSDGVSENQQTSTLNQSNHHTLDTWIDKQSEVTDSRELSEGKVWIDERAKVPDHLKHKYSSKEEDIAKNSPSMPEWVPIVIWAFVLLVIILFNLN